MNVAAIAERVHARGPGESTAVLAAITREVLGPLLRDGAGARLLNRIRLQPDAPVLGFRIAIAPLDRTEPGAGVVAAFRPLDHAPFTIEDLARLTGAIPRLARAVAARVEPETGLLRWSAFEDEISRRDRSRVSSLIYGNLDRMHLVNEVAGFERGDRLIRRAGRAWRAQLASLDALGTHLSGDRFVAVLFDHTLNHARTWAERMRETIAGIAVGERQRGISASFGVVAMPPGQGYQHELAAAETACRVAKERGRNRVEIYEDGDNTIIRRHVAVRESDALAETLDGDRLVLYAQPILPLAPGTAPHHYEILARVQRDDGDTVSLGSFLEAAERYQLLERLDRWVVSRAVGMLAPIAAPLGALGANFALNLTGQSLSQPEFADFVRTEIKRHALPRGLLDFEFTEIAAARNVNATRRFIERMAEIGSRVALDDFGTGVSSLVHLKDLDVFRIKIDGKFVRDVQQSSRSQALIRAIVQIAGELGLETVAEFVEDAAIAEHVRRLGVHYAQGYFYGQAQLLGDTLAQLVGGPPTLTAAGGAG
ncbi:MAG: bifunctional diguanylate cyclase/phosphodiesterase [Gammaproteobacteria bacterium]|nr:bifunctional diguanylate cyclase/phosphodiesterase [Gammaproteobacteria bacterium]